MARVGADKSERNNRLAGAIEMATIERIDDMTARAGRPHVIFVHGLGGHPHSTWMHDANNPAALWPRWIAKDTGCPVWLLGYDAALSGWQAGAMPLPFQGTAVLEALSTAPGLQGQPLVLIGHSLGGLVIKTALQDVGNGGVPRFQWVLDCLKGVVFAATPHIGAELATLAAALRLAMRTNDQVGSMKLHDPHLAKLNQHFLLLQQKRGFKVRAFAETRGVPLPSPWWMPFRGPTLRVVNSSSSETWMVAEPAVMLPEDHFSICKPTSRDAQIHKSVVKFLSEVLHDAGQQLDPAIYVDALPAVAVRLACAQHTANIRVCACVATGDGTALARAIDNLRDSLERSSLLPAAARKRVKHATLPQLAADHTLRGPLFDGLATIGFSAYVYYADALQEPTAAHTDTCFEQQALVHRLRKKSEHVSAAMGIGADWAEIVSAATQQVQTERGEALEPVETVQAVRREDRLLLELAEVVACVVAEHLSDPADERAATAFGHLWTRIRYAENMITHERHTRDRNPLQ